jgi:hypothetical protein
VTIINEIDVVVEQAVRHLRGYIPNADIVERVEREWPPCLSKIEPSPTRIGRSMVRLGYEQWKLGSVRGFHLGQA